jgi:glycosyltransferase involved in cell wall biosynthesis
MKILMLAPEPFFQPRGTPISVYFRIRALSELGHEVDLVTYHLGDDVAFKGLRIFRALRLPFVQRVKIGPSLMKVPLDALLALRILSRLLSRRYDLVFSHEEASYFGGAMRVILGVPHLYDMHSSLPQQLENFNFSRSRLLKKIFLCLERFVLRNSDGVVVICPDLMEKVRTLGAGERAVLLENFLDFDCPEHTPEEVERKRKEIAPAGQKIVLYAGNFEPYQGVPLLLEAAAKTKGDAVLLIVGGNPVEVDSMKKKTESLGISGRVYFSGKVPPSEVPLYTGAADVLVSPRISGTNTPLKIYSFLKTGKPLVATDLWTHTQVLNEKIALLAAPNSESLARAIDFALSDKEAQRRAEAAKRFADAEYTYANYRAKIVSVLEKACSHSTRARIRS